MERAMTKLHNHPEQKALLLSLDNLVIEEIGLPNGELFTINLILQNVRENTCIFGGVKVVGTGDTNQPPAIDGSDVFLSPTILFCFQTHFLTSLVRMLDAVSKQLLDSMSQKPIPTRDIDTISEIKRTNCSFIPSRDSMSDTSVMKVFGEKEAERSNRSVSKIGDSLQRTFC